MSKTTPNQTKSKFGFLAGGVAVIAIVGALALGGSGIGERQAYAAPALVTAAQSAQPITPLPTNQAGMFSFADVVERVSPAVVSVLVEREIVAPRRSARPRNLPQLPDGFERFFGLPDAPEGGPDDNPFEDEGVRRAQAQGSGFFIDAKGHVVTNHHVIADAQSVKISLADGTELEAEVIGSDEFTDLAVLKVKENAGQPFVAFAEQSSLRVGDWVVAVGNPFGLGGTVTSGIVSAIGGRNREQQYVDLIQIDAAINRGNSGGPAFDLSGRVVGVNVAIFSPNGGSVGIGFAIPAATVRATVDQLIETGAVTRGWLGISLAPVSADIAEALDLANTDGVLVNDVIVGTPAAKGGVKNGDVIIALDGKVVKGSNDLSRRIAVFPPGRKVKIKLIRDGADRTLTVTLGKRDDDEDVADAVEAPADQSTAEELGVRISSITEETRQRYRLVDDVRGVVVTAVKPGSPAARAGLQVGVVILEVSNRKIASVRAFDQEIDKVRKSDKDAALLRLQRGTAKQYSALRFDTE